MSSVCSLTLASYCYTVNLVSVYVEIILMNRSCEDRKLRLLIRDPSALLTSVLAYKDTMWLHYSVVSDFTVSKHFCPFNVPPTNMCLCIIIVCACVCCSCVNMSISSPQPRSIISPSLSLKWRWKAEPGISRLARPGARH